MKHKTFQFYILKNFLSVGECTKLQREWNRGHVETGHIPVGSSQTVIDRAYKHRSDHLIVEDRAEHYTTRIRKFLSVKCVEFWEGFRIGGYGPGGHFSPHRDNDSPLTKERRFGFVAGINDDYAGGELYFPQQGITTRIPPGQAVIFSADLQHGVQPVTSGLRLVLITFLY